MRKGSRLFKRSFLAQLSPPGSAAFPAVLTLLMLPTLGKNPVRNQQSISFVQLAGTSLCMSTIHVQSNH